MYESRLAQPLSSIHCNGGRGSPSGAGHSGSSQLDGAAEPRPLGRSRVGTAGPGRGVPSRSADRTATGHPSCKAWLPGSSKQPRPVCKQWHPAPCPMSTGPPKPVPRSRRNVATARRCVGCIIATDTAKELRRPESGERGGSAN